jgi:hypothetical protein
MNSGDKVCWVVVSTANPVVEYTLSGGVSLLRLRLQLELEHDQSE